ncbi:MAG: hypothetical protein IKK57_06020 [Clostridia bacterium]|nr:hypothetical protein [Clostridia bacterium]
MLDLYTHEIPCPDDRAMRKFLWYSVFHDARILNLEYNHDRRGYVALRISGGGYDVRRGEYLLRFHGVQHILYDAGTCGDDRIYATRFLDSARLHREQAESVKPLYHLRIETWCGYIDLIFERFSIRLVGGRVDYRPLDIDDGILAANRDRRFRTCIAELAERLASPRPYDDMDAARYTALGLRDEDLDEYHAFSLYVTAQEKAPEEIAAHARQVLSMRLARPGAPAYAAHLLGFHGTAEDLPRLTELYLALCPWRAISRRIVLDAMERIHERAKEATP